MIRTVFLKEVNLFWGERLIIRLTPGEECDCNYGFLISVFHCIPQEGRGEEGEKENFMIYKQHFHHKLPFSALKSTCA